jgi:hypothetical protein
MRPYNNHKLPLSLEVVTLLLLLCLKFMNTSKNPYRYETAIIIIIFRSIVLPPVSFKPNFTYAGGLSHAIMFYRDDNISLFVSFFDIPVRLGHVFQWISPIDDRLYLPRLYQLFEED